MQKNCCGQFRCFSSTWEYTCKVRHTCVLKLLATHTHRHIREITQNLPVDLDANIAAEFVFDENYWKRRCIEHFLQRNCQISEHGLTWKQLYFENYIQKVPLLPWNRSNLLCLEPRRIWTRNKRRLTTNALENHQNLPRLHFYIDGTLQFPFMNQISSP